MVQEVRSFLFDELFRINKHRVLGSSRKLLGLSFEGETRDADGMIWGDVRIRGLSNDVSFIHTFR